MRYIYDDKDRLTAEQHVTRDGIVTTPTTYTYDNAGRKVKIQEGESFGFADLMIGVEGTNTFINANEASRIESRYDERDEAIEVKVFNTDGVLISRVEIVRDERGNPLEETQYVGEVFPFGSCTTDSCSTEEMAALTEEQQAEVAAEVARLFSPGTVMSRQIHRYNAEGKLIESSSR